MPLPPAAPRRHLHTRAVTYNGFLRDDGLWDIEAELLDTKTYGWDRADGIRMEPGQPIHGMRIRLTVDEQLAICAIATAMDHTPFGECQQGNDPMQQMVGARLGPGWRQSIEAALGNARGCTHLRELLFNMGTAAYQTVFPWRDRERRLAGQSPSQLTEPPYHVGRCIAWAYGGTLVARQYPQFADFPARPSHKKALP